MPGTAPAVGSHLDLVDREAGTLEPAGESAVRPRRPYGEHAARLERSAGRRESPAVVKPVVFAGREPFGAVVDIEQDRIVANFVRPDETSHVGLADRHARIVEAA